MLNVIENVKRILIHVDHLNNVNVYVPVVIYYVDGNDLNQQSRLLNQNIQIKLPREFDRDLDRRRR